MIQAPPPAIADLLPGAGGVASAAVAGGRTNWPSLAALAAIMVVGALLRLPTLGVEGLWFDEAATWAQVNGTFIDVLVRTANDYYPPLYNVFAFVAVQIFGDAEWVLRLPAALFGLANIALIFWLGRRLGGPVAGLVAASMLTVSGFHVWFSHEARMYTLMAFLATWHVGALIRLVERPDRRRAMVAFGLAAALCYTHPYGPLVLGADVAGIVLWGGARRQLTAAAMRRLTASHIAAVLVFVPWALLLMRHVGRVLDEGFWIAPITWESVAGIALEMAAGWGGVVLVLAGGVMLILRSRRGPAAAGGAALLLAWALLPVIAGVAVSLLIRPLLISRYLIGVLPAWLLIAGVGLASLVAATRGPRRAGVAVVIVALVVTTAFVAPGRHHDERGVAAFLAAAADSDDCIVPEPDWLNLALTYYGEGDGRCQFALAEHPDPADPIYAAGDVFLLFMRCENRQLVADFQQQGWFSSLARFNGLDLWRFSREPPPIPGVVTGPASPVATSC